MYLYSKYHQNVNIKLFPQKWSTFPQLQNGRYYHGCGTIRNTDVDSTYPNDLIAIGGVSTFNNGIILDSTEIYRDGSWVVGPNFPTSIYGATVVQYNSDKGSFFSKGFVLISTYSDFSSIIPLKIRQSLYFEISAFFMVLIAQKLLMISFRSRS